MSPPREIIQSEVEVWLIGCTRLVRRSNFRGRPVDQFPGSMDTDSRRLFPNIDLKRRRRRSIDPSPFATRREEERCGEEKEKGNIQTYARARARVIKWPELILLFFSFFFFSFLRLFLFPRVLFVLPPTHFVLPLGRPFFFAGQSRRRGGNALWAQRVIARRADRARG